MRKSIKEIKSAFRQLNYIVYRNKYLIPQRPMRLYINPFIGVNNNIIGSFKNALNQNMTQQFLERAKDPEKKWSVIEEYRYLTTQKLNIQKAETRKYHQKYIKPLKQVRKRSPAFLYYDQNKEEIWNHWKTTGKKYALNEISSYFNGLPESEKKIYDQKAEKEWKKKFQIHCQHVKKYKIPCIKKPSAKFIYLTEQKQRVQKGQTLDEYQNLSKKEKQKYSQKAKELQQEKQKQLISFLKERGLTMEQFNDIKQLCIQIAAEAKQKKNKPLFKQNTREEPKDEFEAKMIEEQQAEEEQECEDIQEELQLQKKSQTVKVQEQQNQDLDFSNEQLNIFELKKKSYAKIFRS